MQEFDTDFVMSSFMSFEFCAQGKMASYTESQPVFEARITAVGLSDDIKESLIANGVTSHSVLAFISEYNPASASEKPFLDAFEDILKRAATMAEKAALRLFHESYATVTKEMSMTVEKNEETIARSLRMPWWICAALFSKRTG